MTLYRVLCLVMRPASISVIVALCCLCTFDGAADIATGAARARELGVPFDGIAGQFNAITDVRGVEVGHTNIVEGGGRLVVGKGPVRTGVTAIAPLGKSHGDTPVPRLCIPSTATVNDWLHMGGGIGLPGGTGATYQHAQRGRGTRRSCRVGHKELSGRENFSLPVVGETWTGDSMTLTDSM